MRFDPTAFRTQFPLFSQPENASLVYLDNAATTQKPQCVIDAITHYYTHQNGNAQRASHRLARAATAMVEQTRELAANFVGAESSQEIVFVGGATAALNMISYGLAETCQAGDEILLSHGEHHANLLPWQRLAKDKKSQLIFFPEKNGVPTIDQWRSVVNERTRIITFSAASNVLGYCIDLSIIAEIKKVFPSVMVIVDASQIACHTSLQVRQWQCDFLVCSAHKFYGPTGIGLLFGKASLLKALAPQIVGGEMVGQVKRNDSTFVNNVQRLEAGTSSLSAIAGLHACLQFWQQQDRVSMHEYEKTLTSTLYQQLALTCHVDSGLKVVSSADNNIGIATLIATTADFALSDLAYYLDEHDIAVRVGDHCAQPLWASLRSIHGSDKGLRISLAAYNTPADIDALMAAIKTFLSVDHSNVPTSNNTHVAQTAESFTDIDWQELLHVKSWPQRYKLLVRWGSRLQQKPSIRQESFLVKGCESKAWFQHLPQGDQHYFLIDSDSNIIKGLSALLLMWFNGKTREEIAAINVVERYEQLGLHKHLSPSRMNGFVALLKVFQGGDV
jgi:SufS family cysteine desulfurase